MVIYSKKQFYVSALLVVLLVAFFIFLKFEVLLLAPPIGYVEPQIWFAPNKGSPDYTQLFTRPDLWPIILRNVDVFEFHPEVLIAGLVNPCSNSSWTWCVNSSYDRLVEIDAFRTLESMGMELSTGSPAVKVWECDGIDTAAIAKELAQNIANAGATLDYITMDQPYIGGEAVFDGQSCGFTMEQSAEQTAIFINEVKAAYPNIKIGDTEPYPYFSSQQIINWVIELENRGAQIDFFQLDVAWGLPDINLEGLRELKEFFESKNIPYAVIYWANTDFPDGHGSNTQWYNDAFAWTQLVKDNDFDGVNHNFHSWEYANPLPVILPETREGQSHTNMVLNSLPFLLDDDATFIGQDVPSQMIAGQTYSVSITLLNSGEEVWSGKKLYGLGSQSPQDNVIWGLGRVYLEANEKIYPGEQKTFTFNITAPNISGTYSFQWQLIHEGIEWFGTSNPVTQISVSNPLPSISILMPDAIQNDSEKIVQFEVNNWTPLFVIAMRVTGQSTFVPYCSHFDSAICYFVNSTMNMVIPENFPVGIYEIEFIALHTDGAILESNVRNLTVQSTPVCTNGQSRSCGVGVCQNSNEVCAGSSWPGCSLSAIINYEIIETICDSLDNDCDGVVDENCIVSTSGSGSSGGSSGGGGGGGGSNNGRRVTGSNPQQTNPNYQQPNGRETSTTISEDNGNELEGQNEGFEIRLFFLSVVILFLGAIVLTIVEIVKTIHLFKKLEKDKYSDFKSQSIAL